MPRYWDGLDFYQLQQSINYVTSDGVVGYDSCSQIKAVDNNLILQWKIKKEITHIAGPIQLSVTCYKPKSGGALNNEFCWSSRITEDLYIAEGLGEGQAVVSQIAIIDTKGNIHIPDSMKEIGVENDHKNIYLTFRCPKNVVHYGELKEYAIYINYMRNDGSTGTSLAGYVSDFDADDGSIEFDWIITKEVTRIKGSLKFLICAKKTNKNGNEEVVWHSKLNEELVILEGLESDPPVVQQYPDIITDLLTRMRSVEDLIPSRDFFDDLAYVYIKDGDGFNYDLDSYYTKNEVYNKDETYNKEEIDGDFKNVVDTMDRMVKQTEEMINEVDEVVKENGTLLSGIKSYLIDCNDCLFNISTLVASSETNCNQYDSTTITGSFTAPEHTDRTIIIPYNFRGFCINSMDSYKTGSGEKKFSASVTRTLNTSAVPSLSFMLLHFRHYSLK